MRYCRFPEIGPDRDRCPHELFEAVQDYWQQFASDAAAYNHREQYWHAGVQLRVLNFRWDGRNTVAISSIRGSAAERVMKFTGNR